MGQNKKLMDDLEAVDEEAVAIAIKVGWLERCDEHGMLSVSDPSEEGHAYAKANWLVTNGKTTTDRESLKQALDRAGRDAGYDCAMCADIAED